MNTKFSTILTFLKEANMMMCIQKIFSTAVLITILLIIAAHAENMTLIAPDGTTVIIERDSYGVPHITAESETGVFYGQGFAAAQDRLDQMETFRRAAEGKLSEWLGSQTMENDRNARRMFYTEAERIQQFNNLSPELQNMLSSYTEGVNTYIDSMNANPAKYKPFQFQLFNREMERWTVYKSVALVQFMMRIFGQAGGRELTRLQELQQNGPAWFDENRPINDPAAFTTIPDGGTARAQNWRYSGMSVRPEVVAALEQRQAAIKEQTDKLGIPNTFGSYAVQITGAKSNSGNVMLLGAPQMGEPQQNTPSIIHEVELTCPTLHAGGMTIAGAPLVVIGHTEHHAWSFTSGASDNSDVYIDSTADASYSQYYHNSQWLDFETIEDTIFNQNTPVLFTHYRTVHGPVLGDDLANHQVYALKMTFWNEELGMAQFLYNSIKATSLAEFEDALKLNVMSFNVFYIDKEQNLKYWHTGKFQDRSDGVDPRLPHKGDGSEEWGGFIPFENLPQAANPAQGYFVNWNNTPVIWWDNGDNIAWGSPSAWADSTSATVRVKFIDEYVGPISGFTFQNLKDTPENITSHGTYQQAVEMAAAEIFDANIAPPGQSGFIDLSGVRSPHFSDQWPLHASWEFKDMLFGEAITGVTPVKEPGIPEQFSVSQNYPNPFNPETEISFELPRSENINLQIYNLRGQLVNTLVEGRYEAGVYKVTWNGADNRGQKAASGIYLYRFTAGEFVQTKKMVLLK
jgi:acyl-homoserine lactone acylase PvdQ